MQAGQDLAAEDALGVEPDAPVPAHESFDEMRWIHDVRDVSWEFPLRLLVEAGRRGVVQTENELSLAKIFLNFNA